MTDWGVGHVFTFAQHYIPLPCCGGGTGRRGPQLGQRRHGAAAARAGMLLRRKKHRRSDDRRLHGPDPVRSRNYGRPILQPRHRLAAQGRQRPCYRRLYRGDPARSQPCQRLQKSRPCEFFAANYGAAASDFARSLQDKSDDAYAVMWLYLARARSGSQNAAKELETNVVKLKQSDWPYSVIELYLWRQTPDEILAATSKLDERCEALFYVGEWHLLRGDQATAAPTLKAAADTCPKTFIEFTGAQAELKRLGP
jgi:hypothetical protein